MRNVAPKVRTFERSLIISQPLLDLTLRRQRFKWTVECWLFKETQSAASRNRDNLLSLLVLIVEGGGSNDLVEKKRGRRFKNLDMPQDFLMCDDPQHQNEAAGVSDNASLCFDLIADEEDNDSDNDEGKIN